MLTCTFEDGGSTTKLRHAVTGMIVVNNSGEILLERRALYLTCGGKVALPGGYLDRDERIFEGAMREVMEETGYETHDPILFLINDKPNRKQEDRQNVEFLILLHGGEKTGTIDKETASIFWASLDKLPPKEEWAFDHFEEVERYIDYLKKPCPLPIVSFDYS